MTPKSNPATITSKSFDCLHCGAFTSHTWFNPFAIHLANTETVPTRWTTEIRDEVAAARDIDEVEKKAFLVRLDKEIAGEIFLGDRKDYFQAKRVHNLNLSECFACNKISIWAADRPVYPARKIEIQANVDLPDNIRLDFDEARTIVDYSPRGAAALLRLAIQKMCILLGESGKKIDDDIANLVKKGLNPLIQQSLDIVRVIGNESVHPGTFDLTDDRETALQLFILVNSIADQMISHPKSVAEMYSKLPKAKRDGIEARDKPRTK